MSKTIEQPTHRKLINLCKTSKNDGNLSQVQEYLKEKSITNYHDIAHFLIHATEGQNSKIINEILEYCKKQGHNIPQILNTQLGALDNCDIKPDASLYSQNDTPFTTVIKKQDLSTINTPKDLSIFFIFQNLPIIKKFIELGALEDKANPFYDKKEGFINLVNHVEALQNVPDFINNHNDGHLPEGLTPTLIDIGIRGEEFNNFAYLNQALEKYTLNSIAPNLKNNVIKLCELIQKFNNKKGEVSEKLLWELVSNDPSIEEHVDVLGGVLEKYITEENH